MEQQTPSSLSRNDILAVQQETVASVADTPMVQDADIGAAAASLVCRRFVPPVKPEKNVGEGASPYAKTAEPSAAAVSDQIVSNANVGGAGRRAPGNVKARNTGKAKGRAQGTGHATSHHQWALERENARLQRVLPSSSFGASGRAKAARAAAAERSAALQADMGAKTAAVEAASAGCAQQVEVLRESHLAKLRAIWDDFLAARPGTNYVALE